MKPEESLDQLFADAHGAIPPFTFDHETARVFADMIRRSVPGYELLVRMTGRLAGEFAQPGTRLYDLGCSLGASTLAMAAELRAENCQMIAVDNSEPMMARFREKLHDLQLSVPVELRCEDVLESELSGASVITMNLTMQFLHSHRRDELVKRIHDALLPGGVYLLAEKTAAESDESQQFQQAIYESFKRMHGYSEMEISQKRTALENVLIPDTPEVVVDRLRSAGFHRVERWFQAFQFMAWIAWK